LDGDWVGIRDSKIECSTILSYSRDEFRDFVKGVKAGEFDDLC
jgi:mRNA-degrading endonuclease YafQ of YafQ-DinJ toxin-antitoxin module